MAFRYPASIMLRRFLLGTAAILALGGSLAAVVWHLTQPGDPEQPPAPIALPAPVAEAPPPSAQPAAAPAPVAPAARPTGRRGRVASDLFTALGALGEGVKRCMASADPAEATRKVVLALEIEPLDGEVRIVSGSPLLPGDGGENLAGCLQAELVGKVVQVAKVKPGRAYRMSFSVQL